MKRPERPFFAELMAFSCLMGLSIMVFCLLQAEKPIMDLVCR